MPKPPHPVFAFPSENGGDYVTLAGFENEWLAGPFAFDVAQTFWKEINSIDGGFLVEPEIAIPPKPTAKS